MVTKYIKAPLTVRDSAKFVDQELRKIETSISDLPTALEELFNMALQIESGSFVATLTGCTTSPQVTGTYAKSGNIVVLFIPLIQGTSNSTACTVTGLPTGLIPSADRGFCYVVIRSSGPVNENGAAIIKADGVIELYRAFDPNGFVSSGTKGLQTAILVYNIN